MGIVGFIKVWGKQTKITVTVSVLHSKVSLTREVLLKSSLVTLLCLTRYEGLVLCSMSPFKRTLPFSHSTENETAGWVPLPTIPMIRAVRCEPAAPRVLSTAVWYTPLTSDPSTFTRSVEPSSLRQTPVILQELTFGDQTIIFIELTCMTKSEYEFVISLHLKVKYLHIQRWGLICRHRLRGDQSHKKRIPH